MRNNAVKMICAAGILAAALFMSACDGGNGDIDLAPEPDLTTENDMETAETVDRRVLTPFIMPKEDTEEYLRYSSKMDVDCVPGYLYLKNAAEDVFYLLTPYEFDEEDGLYQYVREENGYVNWRYVYGVAKFPDGDKILAVDKMSGTFNIVYNSQSGRIELMTGSERSGDNSSYLFFRDGNSLCYLIPSTGETICVENECEVTDIKGEKFIYERINKGGIPEYDAYVCDMCGKDFVIWADGDGQYYWYHIHRNESKPIDFQYLYYPFYCFNDIIFQGEAVSEANEQEWNDWGTWGRWELYARDKETYSTTLLMDNVIYRLNRFTNYEYLFITRQEGVNRMMTVDKRTGESEWLYDFQSDDIQIADVKETYYGDIYDRSIIFRDGNSIIRLNGDTLETAVLYTAKYGRLELIDEYNDLWLLNDGDMTAVINTSLGTEVFFGAENGVSEIHLSYFAWSAQYNLMERFPDVDISDFYVCEECSSKCFYDYVIWADDDMNWFWYHPHSEENEPINVDMEAYSAVAEYDGQEHAIPYITKAE